MAHPHPTKAIDRRHSPLALSRPPCRRGSSSETNPNVIHAVQLDLGHIEGTGNRYGVGTGHHDLVIPDPNLACTNEATPYGESPEATRPDTRGHTARLREDDAIRPASSAMLGRRVSGLNVTVVGMCCVEGSTTSIPSEGVVDQPPGLKKTRGTSKGSWMLTEWGRWVPALVRSLSPSRPDDSPPSVVRRHPKMRAKKNILLLVCF